MSGGHRPADQRRKGARGAADNDVLWRLPLQPHRVHDDVEEDRESKQRQLPPTLATSKSVTTAPPARASPNASASVRETLPRGIGRPAVRVITASMSASYHMLRTPAAPAPTAMAIIATNFKRGSTRLGAIVIPTSAVKTASAITRGFISVTKHSKRAARRDCVVTGKRGTRIAEVFMGILTRQNFRAVNNVS